MILTRALVFIGLILISECFGCSDHPLVTSTPMPNGNTEYALGIQILMVMTVLTLLPAMLITMTAFTRILIVLAILRQVRYSANPLKPDYSRALFIPYLVHYVTGDRHHLGAGVNALSRWQR